MTDFDSITLEMAQAFPSRKWNYYERDVIPSWIADMDFPVADPIRSFIQSIADSGDLCYSAYEGGTTVRELFAARMASRYGWHPDPADMDHMVDIVQCFYLALKVLCNDGEKAIVSMPSYHPILVACRDMQREIVPSPLVAVDGNWEVDFERLNSDLDPAVKVLLLVNPHNPTGRCFRRDELESFADIALRHDLYVVSDEVHCDLVFSDAGLHIPFASLGPEIAERTVTFSSATKSHNLGGVRFCLTHYGSPALRKLFDRFPGRFRGGENLIGNRATQIAWESCDDWLEEVVSYLEGNRDFLADYLRSKLPALQHLPNEATYLAWIDCGGLGLGEDPAQFLLREARVGCYSGREFGTRNDCIRLNFATSRQILEEKLDRIRGAVERISD